VKYKMDKKTIIGGAIGNCVHVAGVFEYLRIAEHYGHCSIFLGSAVDTKKFIEAIKVNKPDIVGVSYRLASSSLQAILKNFCKAVYANGLDQNILYYFGGTPQCIDEAKKCKLFSCYFHGEESLSYIENTLLIKQKASSFAAKLALVKENQNDLSKNINYPLLRHHFGLPDLIETIESVKLIAESGQVDVISLAPDQNAQEYFFEQEKIDQSLSGSGGVPIRTEDDLIAIREAAQTGNCPKLKIYSGTNNLIKWAEMSKRLLNIPWATVPLYWYSILDGRSKRSLLSAIKENIETIRWYAKHNIPVEINESHQWSLRECSDVMAVVTFYLAAYNAKNNGVKKYVAQFMFNTPRLTSASMDLAKMLAKIEMIEGLQDESFTYLKQVRAGLSHFSVDKDVAKGQLSASTLLSLLIRPHIIHVVSYCEANHAASPEDVIESCKIVRGVLRNCWGGFPDIVNDEKIQKRKNELVTRARKVINQIIEYYSDCYTDPLIEPNLLEEMITLGIFDAPHLKGNPAAMGKMKTRMYNGGYECVNSRGNIINEPARITRLLKTSEKADGSQEIEGFDGDNHYEE